MCDSNSDFLNPLYLHKLVVAGGKSLDFYTRNPKNYLKESFAPRLSTEYGIANAFVGGAPLHTNLAVATRALETETPTSLSGAAKTRRNAAQMQAYLSGQIAKSRINPSQQVKASRDRQQAISLRNLGIGGTFQTSPLGVDNQAALYKPSLIGS